MLDEVRDRRVVAANTSIVDVCYRAIGLLGIY